MWQITYRISPIGGIEIESFDVEAQAQDRANSLRGHGISVTVIPPPRGTYRKFETRAQELLAMNSRYGKMGRNSGKSAMADYFMSVAESDEERENKMNINRKYVMSIGPAAAGGFIVYKTVEPDGYTTSPTGEQVVFAGDLDQCLTFLKDEYGENGRNRSRF